MRLEDSKKVQRNDINACISVKDYHIDILRYLSAHLMHISCQCWMMCRWRFSNNTFAMQLVYADWHGVHADQLFA